MNLLEQPTIDNAINKEYVKNTDMQLHELGWKGPVRTAGRSGKNVVKQISYTKAELTVDLCFILNEETLKVETYIFFSEAKRGVSLAAMELFMQKIEEELK